jgi:hypothetical protein
MSLLCRSDVWSTTARDRARGTGEDRIVSSTERSKGRGGGDRLDREGGGGGGTEGGLRPEQSGALWHVSCGAFGGVDDLRACPLASFFVPLALLPGYEINPSLELSLLPYVEMYRSSTYFFCAPQLTTRTVLVGSWWPGGLGSYWLPWRRYDPTKHTSPNYRPWVMSPMYGLVRFYRRAIATHVTTSQKMSQFEICGSLIY